MAKSTLSSQAQPDQEVLPKKKKRKRKGERTDGRMQIAISIGHDKDGNRLRKFFYGDSRADCERQRDAYLKNRELGISLADENTTVKDWTERWKELYKANLNNSNDTSYNSLINRLNARLGSMKIKDIREAHLQSALNEVGGMSMSMITKYKMVITQVFKKAKSNKIIADNPAEDLTLPEGTEGSHRALERWESDCIMNNWQSHRSGLWAMIMMLCGLRRGELVALEWTHVDMDKRKLKVCSASEFKGNTTIIHPFTKTEAGMRTLPICLPLWAALSTVPASKRIGYVCNSAHGKLLTQSAFDRGWEGFNLAMERTSNGEPPKQQGRRSDLIKQVEKENVLKGLRKIFEVRTHDLRHTFATALYDAGVNVKAAQYYLGHEDIRMTLDLYTHLSAERENRSRIQMIDYLDSWLKNDYTNEPYMPFSMLKN